MGPVWVVLLRLMMCLFRAGEPNVTGTEPKDLESYVKPMQGRLNEALADSCQDNESNSLSSRDSTERARLFDKKRSYFMGSAPLTRCCRGKPKVVDRNG
jgi:hypothetical protein